MLYYFINFMSRFIIYLNKYNCLINDTISNILIDNEKYESEIEHDPITPNTDLV